MEVYVEVEHLGVVVVHEVGPGHPPQVRVQASVRQQEESVAGRRRRRWRIRRGGRRSRSRRRGGGGGMGEARERG